MKTILLFALLAQAAHSQSHDDYTWALPGSVTTMGFKVINLENGSPYKKKAILTISVKAEELSVAKQEAQNLRPGAKLSLYGDPKQYVQINIPLDGSEDIFSFVFIAPPYPGYYAVTCITKEVGSGVELTAPSTVHIRVTASPGSHDHGHPQ